MNEARHKGEQSADLCCLAMRPCRPLYSFIHDKNVTFLHGITSPRPCKMLTIRHRSTLGMACWTSPHSTNQHGPPLLWPFARIRATRRASSVFLGASFTSGQQSGRSQYISEHYSAFGGFLARVCQRIVRRPMSASCPARSMCCVRGSPLQ